MVGSSVAGIALSTASTYWVSLVKAIIPSFVSRESNPKIYSVGLFYLLPLYYTFFHQRRMCQCWGTWLLHCKCSSFRSSLHWSFINQTSGIFGGLSSIGHRVCTTQSKKKENVNDERNVYYVYYEWQNFNFVLRWSISLLLTVLPLA